MVVPVLMSARIRSGSWIGESIDALPGGASEAAATATNPASRAPAFAGMRFAGLRGHAFRLERGSGARSTESGRLEPCSPLLLGESADVGHLPLRPRGDDEQDDGHGNRDRAQAVVIRRVRDVLGLGNDETGEPLARGGRQQP